MYGGILIFGGLQEVLEGIASFEVYLYPMFTANVFKALTKPSNARHYHVDVVPFAVLEVFHFPLI